MEAINPNYSSSCVGTVYGRQQTVYTVYIQFLVNIVYTEYTVSLPSITEVPWVTWLLFWDIDSKRKILEFLTRPNGAEWHFVLSIAGPGSTRWQYSTGRAREVRLRGISWETKYTGFSLLLLWVLNVCRSLKQSCHPKSDLIKSIFVQTCGQLGVRASSLYSYLKRIIYLFGLGHCCCLIEYENFHCSKFLFHIYAAVLKSIRNSHQSND